MTYTYQSFISGYAAPHGSEVQYVASIHEAKQLLQYEVARAQQWGAGEGENGALLWKGRVRDVTDEYPDYTLSYGPRGGVSHAPA